MTNDKMKNPQTWDDKIERAMTKRSKLPFALAICLIAFLAAGCTRARLHPGVPVHDSFEGPTLSDLWETDKILPADALIQSKIVRSGHSALQVTLHTSDVFEAGRNGSANSERAELTEAGRLISQEDKTYAFAFSMFIPSDFPIVPTRLVLAQWKQECPGGPPCDDNAPVLAVRYASGAFSVSQTIGERRVTMWKSTEEFRNRWIDFRFRVCFSPSNKGRIIARLNDSLVVDYTGATAYPENQATGYPTPSRFYFKMGLYRDTMTEPMTIYIDDYSKELLNDK